VKLENHAAPAQKQRTITAADILFMAHAPLNSSTIRIFLNGCIVGWRSDICMMGIAIRSRSSTAALIVDTNERSLAESAGDL